MVPRSPPPTFPPITDNERYATAAAVLRTLTHGLQKIDVELDARRIEGELARRPQSAHAPAMRQRLAKLRDITPKADEEPVAGQFSPAIAAALEIIQGGAGRFKKASRETLIAQLEDDRGLVQQAIMEADTALDAIRNELSAVVARGATAAHRKLVLAMYRAAQAFAGAHDAERAFHREFTEAGYTWRDDLLPCPTMRSALVIGSESQWDSEISRIRRILEDLKLL